MPPWIHYGTSFVLPTLFLVLCPRAMTCPCSSATSLSCPLACGHTLWCVQSLIGACVKCLETVNGYAQELIYHMKVAGCLAL